MLKIKAPNYKFCPFCGDVLTIKLEDQKKWKFCRRDDWTYYPYTSSSSNAIIMTKQKVLLVQRNRDPHKKKWMFPAGFIEYGEHPKETVVREVVEETGLKTEKAELFEVLQTTDDPRAPGNLTFYFLVTTSGVVENVDRVENSDIGWFDLNQLPPIAWKDHKKILQKLKKLKNK